MNNRFFVPVLALGIVSLGAAASPSQAATASLGFYEGPDSVPSWLDEVTMTGDTSSWDTATELEAQDGGPYRFAGHLPAGYTGSGTFDAHSPIMPPPSGHSYNFLLQNYGYSGNPPSWRASAGPGSVSNNNNTITFST